jgi:hypothetical protein
MAIGVIDIRQGPELTAAKSDETATVGQGGCYRRIRVNLGPFPPHPGP